MTEPTPSAPAASTPRSREIVARVLSDANLPEFDIERLIDRICGTIETPYGRIRRP